MSNRCPDKSLRHIHNHIDLKVNNVERRAMKNSIEVKHCIVLLMILSGSTTFAGTTELCQYFNHLGSMDAAADFCPNLIPTADKSLNQVKIINGAPAVSTSFVFEMGRDQFFSHPVNDFSAQTMFGDEYASIYAMAFDETGETLYGLENTGKNLVTINQTNGALTVVGPLTNIIANDYVSGLDITPNGTCYVTSNNGATSSFYSCDLTTGALTLIGTQSTTPLLIGIAADCEGNIYGHDVAHDSIYSINVLTGAATLIGLTGLNASYAQDITYDRQQKILYGYFYTGNSETTYGSINVLTGEVTQLLVDSPTGEFAGASKTVCALPDLIFRDGFDNSDLIFFNGFE